MMRSASIIAAALLLASTARADRGALTIAAGGGVSLTQLTPPHARGADAVGGSSGAAELELRYALSNRLELELVGFWDVPVSYFHSAAAVPTADGVFTGTLSHSTQRFGALAGVRYVFGMVWRPTLALGAGWAHRSYSGFQHIDTGVSPARDFGLLLPDASSDALLLAVGAGLEWVGDHVTVGLLPRLSLELGSTTSWVVSLPLTVGWSWYL